MRRFLSRSSILKRTDEPFVGHSKSVVNDSKALLRPTLPRLGRTAAVVVVTTGWPADQEVSDRYTDVLSSAIKTAEANGYLLRIIHTVFPFDEDDCREKTIPNNLTLQVIDQRDRGAYNFDLRTDDIVLSADDESDELVKGLCGGPDSFVASAKPT